MTRIICFLCLAGLLLSCGPKQLQPDPSADCSNCENWNQPQAPFRIYGNTWFVGVAGLSSILIETEDHQNDNDRALILIDGGLTQSAVLIDANIRALGFDPVNISTILVSHTHYDHVGGVAALQRLSGASVFTSPEASKALLSGLLQQDDPQFLNGQEQSGFPPVENVSTIADGDVITVGSVNVKAVYTPGHTPGGMSWTWESCALGTCYDIVYADSLTAVSAEGYRYSDGPAANQLIESAGVISDLDCDILLSPHPFFFGMQEKLQQRDQGNPFVNNVACMIYAETSLGWLEQRLHSEGS